MNKPKIRKNDNPLTNALLKDSSLKKKDAKEK
jgi:hypothetical protein